MTTSLGRLVAAPTSLARRSCLQAAISSRVSYVASRCYSTPAVQHAAKRVLKSLPAAFYRGGTSNAVMLLEDDLPPNRADWKPILLSIMGSPDPYGRQLDGMGGGFSSVSKVCVVKKSHEQDADVEFTFVQLGVRDDLVDYASNCGNMTAAIGPFAVEKGMLYKSDEYGMATVRILNTNTSKIINSSFPLLDTGLPDYDGNFAIDGVPDTAARIKLDFLNPGGSRTGKLLPTGNVCDIIQDVPELGNITVSLIDCANPCVFIKASDLKTDGTLLPDAISAHPHLLAQLEYIRIKASVMMGLTNDKMKAKSVRSVPKVCFVSEPVPHTLLSGSRVEDPTQADVLVRTISTGDPHRAIPMTVAICTAVAAEIPGSVVQQCVREGERTDPEGLVIAHSSGRITVGADIVKDEKGETNARAGTIYQTCRKLFEGSVFYRA